MSDAEMLDFLRNRQSKQRKIIRRSVIPYVAFQMEGLKHQKIQSLIPLSKKHLLVDIDKTSAIGKGLSSKSKIKANPALLRPKASSSTLINPVVNTDKTSLISNRISSKPKIKTNSTLLQPKASSSTQVKPGVIVATNNTGVFTNLSGRKFNPDLFRPNTTSSTSETPLTFTNKSQFEKKYIMCETFGRAFGDVYEVEFAGETWVTDRYYASFTYDITYGFGLRFPFIVRDESTIDKVYSGSSNQVVDYPEIGRASCRERV